MRPNQAPESPRATPLGIRGQERQERTKTRVSDVRRTRLIIHQAGEWSGRTQRRSRAVGDTVIGKTQGKSLRGYYKSHSRVRGSYKCQTKDMHNSAHSPEVVLRPNYSWYCKGQLSNNM